MRLADRLDVALPGLDVALHGAVCKRGELCVRDAVVLRLLDGALTQLSELLVRAH